MKAAHGRSIRLYMWVLGSALYLSGCSLTRGTPSNTGVWLNDGSLALSRPVPTPSRSTQTTPSSSLDSSAAESPPTTEKASLIISRRDKTITATRPGNSPLVVKTEGTQYLKEGSFSVTQKEQRALWYAPKEYFINRALPVPAEGSRERFKRAALGSQTLFLNDQTPIHSGPVWLKEIGGVRVKSSAMSEIYSMVQVGTRVEVR